MHTSTVARTLGVLGTAAAMVASLALPASAKPGAPAPSAGNGTAIGSSGAAPTTAYQRRNAATPQDRKAAPKGPTARYSQDGYCDAYGNYGELCLYWTDFSSAMADFYWSDGNLFDNVFLSPGAGQGQIVANNSESAWNRDLVYGWTVYTGVYGTGSGGYIPPGGYGWFNATFFNNVESIYLT